MSFTSVDLFAGIGGFRIAAERNGGRCVAFSEIAPDAINAYLANHPEGRSSNLGDITAIKALPPHDLLMGGVPCQSWSIAGRNLGFHDDRGQLWNDALYLLHESRPRAFIFENVKGLADPRNQTALAYILDRIQQAGYHARAFVLNSFDYGVPQSRVRIYIVGFRDARFLSAFQIPAPVARKILLKDILEGDVESLGPSPEDQQEVPSSRSPSPLSRRPRTTSLSTNNNGYNDYFLFNDLRNGATTIHSWDILPTTERQRNICLLLLRNRRSKAYGPLDGNPLSLSHFQAIDPSITQSELDALVEIGILKAERYAFALTASTGDDLTEDERFILSKNANGVLVREALACDKSVKLRKLPFDAILAELADKRILECKEHRYDFRNTKISTGLFGINRIFLPSSNIFPTLVASDTNDYVSPVAIKATNKEEYRRRFVDDILAPRRFRKISKVEACRIQGFPDSFILPESRARWMKLLGNSVSVPVIQRLIQAICKTSVFAPAHDAIAIETEPEQTPLQTFKPRLLNPRLPRESRPVQMTLLEKSRPYRAARSPSNPSAPPKAKSAKKRSKTKAARP